ACKAGGGVFATSTRATRAPVVASVRATTLPSAPNAPVTTSTRVSAMSVTSAFGYVDREPALARFLVDHGHVVTGLPHRRDDLVERHLVRAVATHREPRRIDRLDGTHRISFDARDLHETRDRVAREPQVVLHADLRGILNLSWCAVQCSDEPGG